MMTIITLTLSTWAAWTMSLERTWEPASTMSPTLSTSHSGISEIFVNFWQIYDILQHIGQKISLFWTKSFPIRAFVFRPEYQKVAQLVLSRARRDFREKQKKKRKKKKTWKPDELTFVGIHNRRGDHIQYQKEVESIEKKNNEKNTFILNVCFVTGFALIKILRAISKALSQATFLRRWICTDRSLGATNYISQTKYSFFQKGRFHLCVWWCWLGQETATSTGKRDLMDRTATTKYICFCSKNHLLCQCFCHQVKTGDLFFAEDLLEESDAPFSLPEQVWTTVKLQKWIKISSR